MASNLPEFVQWIQALGPVIIGVAVAYVAWRQWRTAREKLVLDLFDKRMDIYDRAVGAMRLVMRDGAVTKNSSFVDLISVAAEAQFLFGDDVVHFLNGWVDRLGEISVAESMLEDPEVEGRSDWIKKKYDHLKVSDKFRPELTKLCSRYLRMTQTK